jgi:hypothetical protein
MPRDSEPTELSKALASIRQRPAPPAPHAVTLPPPVPIAMAEPTYPREALVAARAWQGPRKIVALVAMPIAGLTDCRSCGGEGAVYLRFLKDGPTKQPRGTMEPSTWVASSPAIREGWWEIHETTGYHCPKCNGTGVAS